MDSHPHQPARALAPPSTPDRAHWTPGRQRIFLAALLELGSVTRAARAAGMSRSSAKRLRARLAGTAFDLAWDRALTLHVQRLANPLAGDPSGTGSAPRS